MTVQDYFDLLGYDHHSAQQFFFVRAKAIKEEHSDRYELWYKTTPLRCVYEWWGCDSIMDALVLNTKAYDHAWLSGADWNPGVIAGTTKALLIISPEDYEKAGYDKGTLQHIDGKIKAQAEREPNHASPRNKPYDFVTCREQPRMLKLIRTLLARDGAVEVNNDHETFYGVGFDKWLRDGLADLDCKFEVTAMNRRDGYPWTYLITLNK